MKKNILFALAVTFIGSSAWACTIVVTNDSNTMVVGRDLNNKTGDNRFSIAAGEEKQIGTDPDIHSNFTITIEGSNGGNWHVKQIACSKTHLIPIKTSEIVSGTLDPQLLQSKRYYVIDRVIFRPPGRIGEKHAPPRRIG